MVRCMMRLRRVAIKSCLTRNSRIISFRSGEGSSSCSLPIKSETLRPRSMLRRRSCEVVRPSEAVAKISTAGVIMADKMVSAPERSFISITVFLADHRKSQRGKTGVFFLRSILTAELYNYGFVGFQHAGIRHAQENGHRIDQIVEADLF